VVLAASATAAGRWNMPSRAIQYTGLGYGPGYHAPLVLGPSWQAGVANPGVERLPAPLVADCPPGGVCWHGYTSLAVDSVGPAGAHHSGPPSGSATAPHQRLFPAPTLAPAVPPAVSPPPQPSEPIKPQEPPSPSDQLAPEPLPLPAAGDRRAQRPAAWRW
jgi:hypothetical protein